MKKKNNTKTVIAFLVLALFVLGAFVLLSNRTEQIAEAQPLKITAVQELLLRNLDTNYPASPKEVVKLYSEITRCYYGEQYEEEDLEKMVDMSLKLFDRELAANQTREQYLNSLKIDIQAYHDAKKVISSFSVANSTDVDYYNYLGDEWAQLYCMYSIRVGTNITPVKEKYLLRRDDDGHWKIYGWVLVDEESES